MMTNFGNVVLAGDQNGRWLDFAATQGEEFRKDVAGNCRYDLQVVINVQSDMD
jgi:hypothetical protein